MGSASHRHGPHISVSGCRPPGIREYSNQQLHLNSIEKSQSYGVSNGAPGRTIPINVFDGRKLAMAGNIDRIDQVRLATRQGLVTTELEPDFDYYRDLRAHALVGSLATPDRRQRNGSLRGLCSRLDRGRARWRASIRCIQSLRPCYRLAASARGSYSRSTNCAVKPRKRSRAWN